MFVRACVSLCVCAHTHMSAYRHLARPPHHGNTHAECPRRMVCMLRACSHRCVIGGGARLEWRHVMAPRAGGLGLSGWRPRGERGWGRWLPSATGWTEDTCRESLVVFQDRAASACAPREAKWRCFARVLGTAAPIAALPDLCRGEKGGCMHTRPHRRARASLNTHT